jgi:hypothetical protein
MITKESKGTPVTQAGAFETDGIVKKVISNLSSLTRGR